jgi:hypothetical protein
MIVNDLSVCKRKTGISLISQRFYHPNTAFRKSYAVLSHVVIEVSLIVLEKIWAATREFSTHVIDVHRGGVRGARGD